MRPLRMERQRLLVVPVPWHLWMGRRGLSAGTQLHQNKGTHWGCWWALPAALLWLTSAGVALAVAPLQVLEQRPGGIMGCGVPDCHLSCGLA